MPIRSECDDLIVQIHADCPTHAHRHALAFNHLTALLEVLHNLLCNQLKTLVRAGQGFKFYSEIVIGWLARFVGLGGFLC